MEVEGLRIPELLVEMLEAGRWPRDSAEALQQNNRSLVAEDRPRMLRKVYLYSPPFHTVAQILRGSGAKFYSHDGALHELVAEAVVEIADFGMGSDSPILLDYSVDRSKPRVMSLEWPGRGLPNYWTVFADDFAEFVDRLGL